MQTTNFFAFILFASLCLFSACETKERTSTSSDPGRFTGKKFNEHIRSTEARTPEEQQKGFVLPEGFEIQLYASEPDIGKPINLTFDAKGRMWVTQSFEYPFAASPGEGSDRITILEDTDGDGRADKFSNFSDTLNIPIGIFPVQDGAVAYSIPHVYRFTDRDGDGKSDSKEILLGPFEHRDTHGMVNNFMRGYDGWIHACHGFTNRSTVAGADGDSITMISGNTFRFLPDGSRVEHTTHGRINPFGLAYDERGYLYSTDCHTSPLYQLIRGADYTQWGKEEGMGFAPDMKPLEKEATALAGIAYYADTHFPEDYQSNFYIGDAVASRVYRNSFTFKESTPVGKLEEEFVLSEDPWFRPVDVKLGPDGALYIADFYNSIIGHYEVPLFHPKRDRVRGRIWRITYKGKTNKLEDLTKASAEQLVTALDHDNLVIRLAAADQLTERIGKSAVGVVTDLVEDEDVSGRAYIHGLWVLHRLGALSEQLIKNSEAHEDPLIRLHTMRILLEKDGDSKFFDLITKRLGDKDPHVKRAATELLVKYPQMASLERALEERADVPREDSHLLYTTRLVLRNLLRNDDLMKTVASREWERDHAKFLTDVIVGVPSEAAGVFLARHITETDWEGERLVRLYEHLARYVPASDLAAVIGDARGTRTDDTDFQYIALKGIQQGIARRGASDPEVIGTWGMTVAKSLLDKYEAGRGEKSPDVLAKQKFAAELAGKYKIQELEPELLAFFEKSNSGDVEVRVSALRSLLMLDQQQHAQLAGRILKDTVDTHFKNRVASMLGEFSGPTINKILADVNNAPPDLQSAIVMALATSPEGKNIIFRKVKAGELLPRTLMQPQVEERMMLNISPRQKKEYEAITAKLDPIDRERQALIATRILDFTTTPEDDISMDSGKLVFKQNCSACHSIGNEGGSIGPQLDGVGKWGHRALTEKIIDPNRNISEAFRNYTITTKDGKVMTGLLRREEGQVIVFADITGREFSVPKNQIAEQKASKYTLMPDHFGEVLSQDEFNALLKYLLSLQS